MWGWMMNNKIQQETVKMCLRVVTPINIADGTILGAKDYFYDVGQGKVYFLNLHEWHKFIYAKGLLASYEKYVVNINDKRNLLKWLQGEGFSLKDVGSAVVYTATVEIGGSANVRKESLNDIIKHIKQVDGSAYIPGSSVKGVLRTAIIYHILCRSNDLKNKFWNEIKYCLGSERIQVKELNKIANNLESTVLHTLKLENNGKEIKPANAVCSALRGLQVSDSYAAENAVTSILQKEDVGFDSRTGRVSPHSLSVFRECVLPEAEFYFDLKLEKAYMDTLGIKSVDDLLAITKKYQQAVQDILKDAFAKGCPEPFAGISNANMWLGGNTGFLSKTLLALLAPDKKQALWAVKKLLDNSFRKHNHIVRDKIISPRTLKCTTYKNKLCMMGLAEVTKA